MNRGHVVLKNVTRVYPGAGNQPPIHALGPVELDLRKAEFFSVVGPSGCGKSTLLEVMAGLARPSSGEITFEGVAVAERVPDGVGVGAGEVRRRVDYAVGFMGLKDFAHAFPAQLSGGMRQRVCIARTLVMQPRLILLDEPFGALDQQTRLLMGDELLRLWRETGATVLLITHALDEPAMLADRVGVMSARPGRFIETVPTGWPRERDSLIVARPEFGQITGHLWSLLREESLKALQGGQ